MSGGSVIRRIAINEVRAAWRSRGLMAMAATLVLLTGGAAIVGHQRYHADAAHRGRFQQVVADQFASQPDRHPHRVAHYGFLVFRPRAPLGFFDSGIEGYAGTSIFLEAHRQNTANFSTAVQSGSTGRFGELTLAQVLQVFVPLFIFGLGGASITREREAGTLPLLLCQGVSWPMLLTGKLLGVIAVAALVVTPAVVVSAMWLMSGADVVITTNIAARLATLAGAHGLFLAGCAALAVAVSARMRSSRAAMVLLLSVWVGLWVVLPRVLPAAANLLYPVPSRAEFIEEVERRVRELGDSHNPNDPRFAEIRRQALHEHGATRVEELPFNYSGFVMSQSERMTSEAFQQYMTRMIDIYHEQARLVDAAGLVSPLIGIRMLSMAVAGSDAAHVIEFDRQAETYRYQLIQQLNTLHTNEVPLADDRYAHVIEGAPSRLRIDRAFFQDLPAFAYEPPQLAWSLQHRWPGAAALLVSLVLMSGIFAWACGRREL